MAHLVKKSSKFVDAGVILKRSSETWHCETRINGNPSGHSMQIGDKIYFAETGYAIYAMGTVSELKEIAKIFSLDELFSYYQNSNIKSSRYWFSVANEKIFLRNDTFKFLSIFEYKSVTKPLQQPIFLPKEFRGQSSYFKISDNFIFDNGENNFELTHKIPSALRLHLFNKWNVDYDKPMIDIDHFVPSSLGGPGNIEENLEIVGLSINRTKGNSVPRGVFVIGKAFCEFRKVPVNIPSEFTSAKTPLEKSPAGKDVAKKIISAVNSKENTMDEIRNFYADVKNSTGRPRTHHDRYLHIFTQTSGFCSSLRELDYPWTIIFSKLSFREPATCV